ncbi:NAD(P)-binding domain [Phytophthora cactorum]|nr:NAD(P)-binding domain [Phytophthora cactorum]
MSLANRIAIVTGAASGLGRATATRFVQNGARVILCDLPTSDGANVARELGVSCHFSPTDVTNEDDVTAALDLAESSFGEPTLSKKGVHQLFQFQQTINVNTVGSFNVARLAAERKGETYANALCSMSKTRPGLAVSVVSSLTRPVSLPMTDRSAKRRMQQAKVPS